MEAAHAVMRLAALCVLAAVAAGCGGGATTVTVTTTVTTTRTVTTTATATTGSAAACAASALAGSFDVVPGSAGAGQIAYSLTLTNTSASACSVSGLPQVQLLDSGGTVLPTHVSADQPGQPAPRVDLAPGGSAHADARFSPDVPGTGEQQTGPCEPAAARLRVAPLGGGTLDVPVHPPTSVCEHGSLQFRAFVSGR